MFAVPKNKVLDSTDQKDMPKTLRELLEETKQKADEAMRTTQQYGFMSKEDKIMMM